MAMNETRRRQMRDWTDRLHAILGEMEDAFGDPPPGSYPPRALMLLHCAWCEMYPSVAHDDAHTALATGTNR